MKLVFDLQNEISIVKAVKDMPHDLIKAIQRGYARGKKTLLTCFELNKDPAFHEETVSRRARSKPRSSEKHRRRKDDKGLGLENIGYTLDKLQEIDG